jgi:ferredoxin
MILTRFNPMPIVSIKDTNLTFEVPEGEILFDALNERGHKLPHGCLSGSCGACRIEVCAGKENLQEPSVVEENTICALKDEYIKNQGQDFIRNREIRLSCRAKVRGDVTITPLK